MVHRAKAVIKQVKQWSPREQLALFGMLLTYLKLIGLIKSKKAGVRTHGKKKKGPPKGKVPPQLRPYLFKKGHRKVRKKKRRSKK